MNGSRQASEDGGTIQVLLVDDEEELLDATARALARRGFTVQTACDGAEALTLIGARDYDVVVLDIKMPGIDGVEVFHRVRQARPGLPVVMLTGHGTIQQAFTTSREGVFDYLAKPCDVEQLAETLRRAAASSRCERAAPPPLEVRLLFVDDEPELLESLGTSLTRRGMRVTAVPEGGQALGALRRQVFDVVLLDLRLPGMDGLALLRQIKAIQPCVEVIILTGHASMDATVEGLRDGAFDFLVKPQEPATLARKIHQACQLAERNREQQRQSKIRQVTEGKAD